MSVANSSVNFVVKLSNWSIITLVICPQTLNDIPLPVHVLLPPDGLGPDGLGPGAPAGPGAPDGRLPEPNDGKIRLHITSIVVSIPKTIYSRIYSK